MTLTAKGCVSCTNERCRASTEPTALRKPSVEVWNVVEIEPDEQFARLLKKDALASIAELNIDLTINLQSPPNSLSTAQKLCSILQFFFVEGDQGLLNIFGHVHRLFYLTVQNMRFYEVRGAAEGHADGCLQHSGLVS